MEFREWARAVRNFRDMTYAQVAAKMGLDQGTLSRMELGKSIPSEATVRHWSLVMGVDQEEAIARLRGLNQKDFVPPATVIAPEPTYPTSIQILAADAGLSPGQWADKFASWLRAQPPGTMRLIRSIIFEHDHDDVIEQAPPTLPTTPSAPAPRKPPEHIYELRAMDDEDFNMLFVEVMNERERRLVEHDAHPQRALAAKDAISEIGLSPGTSPEDIGKDKGKGGKGKK